MKDIIVAFCAMAYISKAAFSSYEGGSCAFVYDEKLEAMYPLDICIPSYDASSLRNISRRYECTLDKEGNAEIERRTYYNLNCTGSHDETTSALGNDNLAYSCGSTPYNSSSSSVTHEKCYVEYKRYTGVRSECGDYKTASYTTNYIIVAACMNGPDNYQYMRCDPDTNDVQYVLFNDDECCDLTYSFTGRDGPAWRDYDAVQVGCDSENNVYIPADEWSCNIPEDANDADVFTDNTDSLCMDDDAHTWMITLSMIVSVVAIMST